MTYVQPQDNAAGRPGRARGTGTGERGCMKDDGNGGDLRSGGLPAQAGARARNPGEDDAGRRGNGLDDFTRGRLGLHLRSLYDQMAQQPVPDRFRDLIAKLEAGETRGQDPPPDHPLPDPAPARKRDPDL